MAAAILRRTDRTVTAMEVAGFAAFGATAVAAVALGGRAGTVLVALAIGLHGVWDIVHHRRDIVVARSYAEFCAVPDLVLAGLLGGPQPLPDRGTRHVRVRTRAGASRGTSLHFGGMPVCRSSCGR